MANSIVVEREAPGEDASKPQMQKGARGDVVGEIMGDIATWRRLRDADFEHLWDEFYAKWRGFWMPQHKSFKTERSKLISPLTAMSVDLTSAEIIEAVLGREYFIDLPDNIGDDEQEDMESCRKLLVQDLRGEGFVDEFALTALNGCLYGTGITKIQILTKKEKTMSRDKDGKLSVVEKEVVAKSQRARALPWRPEAKLLDGVMFSTFRRFGVSAFIQAACPRTVGCPLRSSGRRRSCRRGRGG